MGCVDDSLPRILLPQVEWSSHLLRIISLRANSRSAAPTAQHGVSSGRRRQRTKSPTMSSSGAGQADRGQLSEVVQRARDGALRTNDGKISSLDDAVATFNSPNDDRVRR